jgi:hypothetical protein
MKEQIRNLQDQIEARDSQNAHLEEQNNDLKEQLLAKQWNHQDTLQNIQQISEDRDCQKAARTRKGHLLNFFCRMYGVSAAERFELEERFRKQTETNNNASSARKRRRRDSASGRG